MNETLEHLQVELSGAIRELDATKTQARRAEKWSIQQIVEHLLLTYAATEAVVEQRLARGRATQAKPTIRQHLSRVLVVNCGYFPKGVLAPPSVVPPQESTPRSGEELVRRISECLSGMDKALHEASSAFGERNRSISHVVLGPLTPKQWRRFHLVHGLHHVRQIEATKIREGLGR